MGHLAMGWESNHGKDEALKVLEHKRMSLYKSSLGVIFKNFMYPSELLV